MTSASFQWAGVCLVAQWCPLLCVISWTVAPARLLCPWGFSRQEYWSGLPCPSPGGLPNPGIELRSPSLQADSLPSEPPEKPSCGQVLLLIYLLPLGTCTSMKFSEYAFHQYLWKEGRRWERLKEQLQKICI